MLKSWIKTWFTKPLNKKPQDSAEFYENYFSLIASGARLKLVEAMFNLNFFDLFQYKINVLEDDIIQKLGLMPVRAKKWLHLLSCENFIVKVTLNNQPAYRLTDGFIKLRHSDEWEQMKFFFNSWNYAAEENLTDVLRYGQVKMGVSWPPKTDAEAIWLEEWMTRTSNKPIQSIQEHINFKKVKALLDVGGGDGTMACAFSAAHPHLKAAVYNLPKPAAMARENIAAKHLSHQVNVIEGDFIKEDVFPRGYDLILFTRVLFDWNEEVDRKLLTMAYQALPKNGLVAICEFYKEENNDRCLAAEYRYIFHDDFTPSVMKTADTYKRMLREIGFTMIKPNIIKEPAFTYCSVIIARK